MKKRTQSIILVLSMILSLFPVHSESVISHASSAPKLSKSNYTFTKISTSKDFSVKNVNALKIKSVTFSSSNKNVASAVKLSKKKFRVFAYDYGKTTITVKLKIKKTSKKTKTYKRSLKIYVKLKTVTPTPSINPTVKPSASPSATPTISPSASPTISPSVSPSASPSVSPSASPSASPSVSPSATPSEQPQPTSGTVEISFPSTPAVDENEAYSRIIAMKQYFPDYTHWDNNNQYAWYNVLTINGVKYNRLGGGGCVGIAMILSDMAFGKTAPAVQIDNPSPESIKIGDILRVNNDTHSVIVIGKDSSSFTVAEGNVSIYDYNGFFIDNVIMWGRQISKNDTINYVWTRW